MDETGWAHASDRARLLARPESAEEEAPSFDLRPGCIGESLAAVAHAASAIPRGLAATGGIAAAAGAEARPVGHLLATNHLHPIIRCRRAADAALSPRSVGLTAYPVERAIAKALSGGPVDGGQLSLR